MAFRQIKSGALANQAVISTKLSTSAIDGQVALASVAQLDYFLVFDNDTQQLKKVSSQGLVGSWTTADLAEDASALYFTDLKARTAVAGDIAAAVATETARASAAEVANASAISAEAAARAAADTALQSSLSTEVTRATNRENSIEAAFLAADLAITARIDNVLSNVDSAALDSLTEIVAAFQDADNALSASVIANSTAISNEVTRAVAAETANASAISAETTARQGADATLQSAITTEAAARTAADVTLAARVTTNEGDIGTLQTGLAAEIAATDGEVLALQNSVAAETTRAQAAEAANASNLAAEITARAVADTAVRSELGADIVAAQTAAEAHAEAQDVLMIGDATVDGTSGNTITDRIGSGDAATLTAAKADATAKVAAEATLRVSGDAALQAQITSNDGDITALQTSVSNEVTRATTAEAGLQSQISNIISNTDSAALDSLTEIVAAFQAADTNMSALISSNTVAISAEAGVRASADTTLQSNITAEASTRAAADATLTSGLAQEVADRTAADLAVAAAAAVDASTKATAAETAAKAFAGVQDALLIGDASVDGTSGNTVTDRIADAVAVEATARAAGDAAEAALRVSGDAALSLRATSLEGRMDTAEFDIDANTANIATEQTARAAADTTLQGNITAEATLRAAADTQLTADLLAEQVARIAGDSAAGVGLAQEIARATAVEAGLRTDVNTNTGAISINAGAITSEAAARAAADITLGTAISDETAARVAADALIQTDLDLVESRVDAMLNGSSASLDTLLEIVTAFEDADSDIQVVITNNSSRLTTNEGKISTLETEMNAVEGRALTLETEMNAVEAAAVTLAGRVTTAESDIGALETKVGASILDTIAQNLSAAVNELHTDTNAVAGRVSTAESAIVANASAITQEASRATAEETSIRADFTAADTSIRSDFAAADAVTLNAAKTDATTKANTAEANAKTYADGLVTAEAALREAADDVLEGQITTEATARASADNALDTRVTTVETEMTATQAAIGVNTDGTYVARTGTNYLNGSTSVRSEATKLDVALKAEETARIAADNTLTTNLATEVAARIAGDAGLQGQITAEVTRATAAEGVLTTNVTANATAITAESTRAQGEETRLEGLINNIIANTDSAALDSLTEIVAAFQSADGTITGLVQSNQTAIATNATAIATEVTDRVAAVSAEAAARAAADTTLQSNIDGKVAKAGDTMSGILNMGSNKISALANGVVAADAVNKGQLDTGLAAQHISQFTTDNLAEGVKKYFSDALAQAAISTNDVGGEGKVSYAAGVVSVDTRKSVLELVDVSETSYAGKASYVMQVKADESGFEFIHPDQLSFVQPNRQVIDGDGVQTQFAITFYANIDDAMVFVGGVIQDPNTHYTFDNVNQEIVFTEAIPAGSQAVIISHAVGAMQVIAAGSVTHESLAGNVKAYVQGTQQTVGTVEVAVSSFPKELYRSAKYIVSIESPDGLEFETRECLVVHNGTNAFITEYGVIFTGSGTLGDTDVRVNSGTGAIELTYTANASGTKVTITSTYVDA
mgnify:CR=1 FL=1